MHSCFFKQSLMLTLLALAMVLVCQDARADDYETFCLLSVESPRRPKRVCFAAENMTVVTASDIEKMNARTVAEILENVTGVFTDWTRDFTSPSLIFMQGSDQHHVAVFVDGVRWNFLSSGAAETSPIPVDTIGRMEIIRGPASSSLNSALGGVINIITKKARYAEDLSGSARFSYGKGDSQDYRAQLKGRTGNLRYYLYGGRKDSDGVRDSRYYRNSSFYSKFYIPVSGNTDAVLTAGYSEPRMKLGDYFKADITSESVHRTFFTTASFNTSFSTDFQMSFSFHHFRQKAVIMNDVLGLGVKGEPGDPYSDSVYDDETTGGSGSLFWKKGINNVVFGADFDKGKLSHTFEAGPFLRAGVCRQHHPLIMTWIPGRYMSMIL